MKWLFVLASTFALRDSVAIIGRLKNALGFGEEKTEQFYNVHCKFETGNELVCFVDVLNWEAKKKEFYEKDGVVFCGAFTTKSFPSFLSIPHSRLCHLKAIPKMITIITLKNMLIIVGSWKREHIGERVTLSSHATPGNHANTLTIYHVSPHCVRV